MHSDRQTLRGKAPRIFLVYIDDIVIFSKIVEEHLIPLTQILQIFADLNIALKLSKFFFGFSSISLLGEKVDSLGLTTSNDKLKAILNLFFPDTLSALETYNSNAKTFSRITGGN